MNYLVVVAHPDDEVIGAGGTIHRLLSSNNEVAIVTMCNSVSARNDLSSTLIEDKARAYKVLGVESSYSANFPNIKMNTVPHLEMVQFIEKCIVDFGADAIITHHPADTNNDHIQTSYAAQAASRLSQRKENVKPLRLFLYMEISSSTEWSLDSSSNRFTPNYFVEIGEIGLQKKMEALRAYTGVMRPYPHPRSEKAITGLANYRGSQGNLYYAEAFECVFWSQ